jgi:hypothetical protein
VRQTDCSVAGYTFTNVVPPSSYAGTFSGTFTATGTPNYGSTLHTLAGLTTKAGSFANGCTDKTAGVAGLPAVLLARTSAGVYVGSSIDLNNNLYIGAINPAGTFTAARVSLPSTVISLNVGDVNSEGVRQLIALGFVAGSGASYSSSLVYTINVHPDGAFDPPVTIPTTASASFPITVDDFNGDGKLDIALAPSLQVGGNQPFTVLPGKGNGAFGAAITSVTSAGGFNNMITGDFNGDGKRDVVVGTSLLLGKGDGTFTLGPAAPPVGAVVTGDFNKDGKDDIAATSQTAVSIYLSNGDGTFSAFAQNYASLNGANLALAVTDIDGDGNLDLVVGQGHSGIYGPPQYGQGMTMFLLGNGDGTFQGAPAYLNSAGSGPHGAFAAGDFNGDGKVDVLAPNRSGQGGTLGMQLLTGNGHGALTPQPAITSVIPSFVAAADVNGDSKLDAVTLSLDTSGNSLLTVLNGNGDGTFMAPQSFPVAAAATVDSFNLALGDTRGTKNLDAVINAGGLLYFLKNHGDGTFAAATQIDSQADFESISVADLNGDGKADIVANVITQLNGPYTSGEILVYLSHGDGTFASPVNITAVTNGADMILADVNKDGKPDIEYLSADTNTGIFSLNSLLGHGDGSFATGVSSTMTGQAFVSMAAADVNGDGNPDIMIGACCGATLGSIAYGHGDGTFTANAGISIAPSSNAVAFADFNNDGHPDVLLATNRTLVVALNTGTAASSLSATNTGLTVSPAAPTAGQAVKLTATVAPATGSGNPSGTVTFYDGTTSIGTGTVSSGSATASVTFSAGAHSLTASYSGDTTFAGSASAVVNLTVTTGPGLAATSTNLTASPTTGAAGSAITFTATVSETSGATTPTGTVTFYDGTNSLGTGTIASGVATYSATSLSTGAHSITATYGGDAANAASTSATVTVTITAATGDFTIALGASGGAVTEGSSATTTVSITPTGGFNQQVSLACSGLPANTSCSFSPAAITPSGTIVSTSTLTIATNVKTAALPASGTVSLAGLAAGAWLGLLLLRGRRKHRHIWHLQIGLISGLLCVSAAMGCGGGSSTGTTPKGTSQITVTATAGSTTHAATYSLTVQ